MRALRLALVLGLMPAMVLAKPKAPRETYALIETSEGRIVARLFTDLAPKTCAKFIGLATGKTKWFDPLTEKSSNRPLYDGTFFHRVIPGFMVQGGDPRTRQPDGPDNRWGTGGPGFEFDDEFHPSLRHSKPGILSMANGGPNTNGSQFFITVAATPWLDDRHTIFGEVIDGMDVVNAIARLGNRENGRTSKPVALVHLRIVNKLPKPPKAPKKK